MGTFVLIRPTQTFYERIKLREVPELATEIAAQEKHLVALTAELAKDGRRFQDEAESILSATRVQPRDSHTVVSDSPHTRIRAAYDRCLRNWLDTRNNLASEHLSLTLKEMTDNIELRQLKATTTVLKRIQSIRRIYAALEILAPTVFAVFAILYVWLL